MSEEPTASAAEPRMPFSLEAEQMVLGAILFDNEAHTRVSTFLRAEHFFDPVHGAMYAAIDRMITLGRVASPVLLNNYMQELPAFKEIGGEAYLNILTRAVPSAAGVVDYGRLVFDAATRRGLIRIGTEMIERAQTASLEDDPNAQMSEAEAQLFSLAETGRFGRGFEEFKSALATAVERTALAFERGGGLSGLSTGFRSLDEKLGGLHPSDLIILAGRPSMGKSALATNIAVNVARAFKPEFGPDGQMRAKDGAVVGLFSLEMSAEQLAGRVLAEYAGVDSHRIRRGDIDQSEFERISEAAAMLHELPLHIDDSGGLSIGQIAARSRRLKRKPQGLGLLVIDYLQLLSGSKKAGDNRVQELTEITTGLKSLAKELNIPIIALSQLSRQVEQREDKKPQLSDLRESGSIEQDADVVMFVFREEYYLQRTEPKPGTPEYQDWLDRMNQVSGRAEIIIGKQRHGPIGSVGMAFEGSRTRFSDPPENDRFQPSH